MRFTANLFSFTKALTGLTFTFVEVTLFLRFLLKLLGANPNADFVAWLYQNSEPLLQPFADIFPSPVLDGQYVFEFNTLFAWIIYMILYMAVIEVINVFQKLAAER